MRAKSEKPIEISVPILDSEPLIDLREASRLSGYRPNRLRLYAIDGTIPGGRQAGKGKRWVFIKSLFLEWVETFNAPRTGEN